MPAKVVKMTYKEPTVTCPNCGALVPPTLADCPICDEKMPIARVVARPIKKPAVAMKPAKLVIKSAGVAPQKVENATPIVEKIPPAAPAARTAERPAEDRNVAVMLELEREQTPPPVKVKKEALEELKETAAKEVAETVRQETVETGVKEAGETVEEERMESVKVEISEVADRKSYKGLALASAGGLVYALSLILFVPLLGNFAAAMLVIPAALMIVGGSNIAVRESAAVEKTRKFSCPLCGHSLDAAVKECTNCGALFSD